MKYVGAFVILTVFSFAVQEANASLMREQSAKSSTQPNKCFSSVFKLYLKINKDYKMPGECGVMRCNKNYEITYATCGTVGAEGNYKIVQDKSLPYPECCPRVEFLDDGTDGVRSEWGVLK